MARVTIEDCLEKVDDRFELVALAAQRAKDIASGAPLTIERKGEKNTVVALREIAESTVAVEDLRENLVKVYQRVRESEDVLDEQSGDAIAQEMEGFAPTSEELQPGFQEDADADEALDAAEDKAALAEDPALSDELAEELSFAEDNLEVDD